MPLWVAFQTTMACNLKCPHCETHGTTEANRIYNSKNFVMPQDLLRSVASESLLYAPEFALALNGEPLAAPGVGDFLEFARPFGSKLDLTTNATLLTADRLVKLLPVLGQVHVSLDGATPYTIERIRLGAKYQQLLRNIALLVRLSKSVDFTVDLCFTVMASNVRELPSVIELAHRLGIERISCSRIEIKFDHVRNENLLLHKRLYNACRELALQTAARRHIALVLPPEFPQAGSDLTPPQYGTGYLIDSFPADYDPHRLADIDLSDIEDEAQAILKRLPSTADPASAETAPQVAKMRAELDELALKHSSQMQKWWTEDTRLPYCHYMLRASYFASGGDVYTCCVPGRPVVGNIGKQSVREVWNGELMDDFRRRFHSPDPYPCCEDCQFRSTIPARELFTSMGVEHIADPEARGTPLRYEELKIRPGSLTGHVDALRYSGDTLLAEGWSYDPHTHRPAHRIAVASGDQVIYSHAPNVQRPDLVAATGRESLRSCGFRFHVPGIAQNGVRILAISSENVASEITPTLRGAFGKRPFSQILAQVYQKLRAVSGR